MQHGVRPQRRHHVTLAGDDAEGGVVVAADPLRRRVQHEVDAVADRLLTERRGERRVDERERAGDRPELVEVDEVEPRIRWRLGDHEHRLAGHDGGGERPRFGAVDPRHVDAHAGAWTEQEGARPGVDLALGDDVIAGRAQPEHDGGDGSHAGGEGEGVLGALQLGDGLLERPHRRVGVAAVEVVGASGGGSLAGVVEPAVCHTLVAHNGGVRLDPCCDRPAETARVLGDGPLAHSCPLRLIDGVRYVRPVWTSAEQAPSSPAEHQGSAPPSPASSPSAAPRSSSPTCKRTRARNWRRRSAGHSPASTSPTTDDIVAAVEMAKSIAPLRVPRQLGGHRLGPTHGRQGRLLRLGGQPRCLQEGHRHQPHRQLRLHPHRRHGDEHHRAARVGRAWRHRQRRVGGRLRRADRPGGVLGVEGRHRRHDAPRGSRSRRRWRARQHGGAGPDRHADLRDRARRPTSSRPTCRRACCSRSASAGPRSWRRWCWSASPTRTSTPRRSASTAGSGCRPSSGRHDRRSTR